MNQCVDLLTSDLYQAGAIGFMGGIIFSVIAGAGILFWLHEDHPRPSDFNGYLPGERR